MEDVRVNIRISEKLVEAIRASGDVVSEVLRAALEEHYLKEEEKPGLPMDKVIKKVMTTAVYGGFRLPVGDVICYGTNPQTQLWWCPTDRLAYVKELCGEWESSGGFKFHVGQEDRGSWYMPEVIEDVKQERGRNKQFAPSCRMVEAHVGDRMVWLTIENPSKALDFMRVHTDIPCALRCDIHRYADKDYKAAFDMANELFIHYWNTGRPKRLSSAPLADEDIYAMYDV